MALYSVKDIPDEIDEFWEKAEKDYSLAVVRNREYLSWRYINNPDNYLIYLAKRAETDQEEIVGFLAVKQNCHGQYPIYKIADYLTVKDDGSVFIGLLSQLITQAKKHGIIAISTACIKNNFYYRLLRKMGFLTRNPITVICNNNSKLSTINPGQITHLTPGDSDNV